MMKFLSLLFVAALLSACGETEEKIEKIDKSQTESASTIRNDENYEFELVGDRNVYRLEDKIESIEIDGDENYITVVSDALIDVLVVNGHGNVIDADDSTTTTFVDVEINGDNNVVNIYDAANVTIDGTNSLVRTSAQ